MRSLIITLIIWSVCFAAITISAALTYAWYRDRGPEIKITFKNTAGLIPNQSKIMYRGAQIGRINNIHLDLKSDNVVVHARVSKQSSKMLGKDSKFWIVQPEFSIEKISNLHAIATGDYIAVEPVKGVPTKQFVGWEDPPLEPRLAAGLRLHLKATTLGGINNDSPILYRGLHIGEVWEISLTKDKRYALITIYIYKEFADLIRKNSYFGNVSGFHANLRVFGTSRVGIDSLRTLFKGGITVTSPNLNGQLAKDDDTFRLLSAEEVLDVQEG